MPTRPTRATLHSTARSPSPRSFRARVRSSGGGWRRATNPARALAVNNRLGSRLTLALGSMGYALYIGAYLSYNINQNGNFIIAAGAIRAPFP